MTRQLMLKALSASLVTATTALAGPEWPELGDAGNLPGNAQIPGGSGSLGKITGALTGFGPGPSPGAGDFQDMYRIYIDDPDTFSASTNPMLGGDTSFDTQLWLFTLEGAGLLANDDATLGSGYSTLLPLSTDGSGSELTHAGFYYLAVSGYDSDPISNGDLPIFLQPDRTEISGPDGPGGLVPISGWGPATGDIGTYEIAITGASFTPAPGALALLILGAGGRNRRRD